MFEFLERLPLEGWIALLSLAGAALWKPIELLTGHLKSSGAAEASADVKREEIDASRDGTLIQQLLDRAHDLEAMLEVLRKALDKNLVRENAVVTAAELLLGIVELIDEPTPAMKAMRIRAIDILELARRMNGGTR
jgi:hypothetical protein